MSNDRNDPPSPEQHDLEDNYYAILNVSRDVCRRLLHVSGFSRTGVFISSLFCSSKATDKEITQAYHRLGLTYHPDKQKNPENRKNAELLFSNIRKAFEGEPSRPELIR